MRLVVDASVAVKWLVDEDDSLLARRLLDGSHEISAPRLMATEVGNALRRKTLQGDVERKRTEELAEAIPLMVASWILDELLTSDALRLALTLNTTVPDCLYLALSRFIGATLVTADRRFVNAASNTEYQDSVTALDAFTTA